MDDRPEMKNRLLVCITGDIDDFSTETIECLECYCTALARNRVRAEFFITALAAARYPERVEYLLKHHQVVGGHGDIHQGFYESVSIQTERLKAMKKTFSDLFGLTIEGFRAPWYCHNACTYRAVDAAGLRYDCSKKRMEIAFKRIPFFEKRYMYTSLYPLARPLLKLVGSTYNWYCNAPPNPYFITPHVLEFPTLGISDYSLIGDPRGPRYPPDKAVRIGEIWVECLNELRRRGGGVMTLQAHPGRLSPHYIPSLEHTIHMARAMGAEFTTPNELMSRYPAPLSPDREMDPGTRSTRETGQ